MRFFIVILTLSGLVFLPPQTRAKDTEHSDMLTLPFDVHVGGMHALTARFDVPTTVTSDKTNVPAPFDLNLSFKTQGLLRYMLSGGSGFYKTQGQIIGSKQQPLGHQIGTYSRDGNRLEQTLITYDDDGVVQSSRRLETLGTGDAKKIDRDYPHDYPKGAVDGSIDILTALWQSLAREHPCDETLAATPVFDGKRIALFRLTQPRIETPKDLSQQLSCVLDMTLQKETPIKKLRGFFKLQALSHETGKPPRVWMIPRIMQNSGEMRWIPTRMMFHSPYGGVIIALHKDGWSMLEGQHAELPDTLLQSLTHNGILESETSRRPSSDAR